MIDFLNKYENFCNDYDLNENERFCKLLKYCEKIIDDNIKIINEENVSAQNCDFLFNRDFSIEVAFQALSIEHTLKNMFLISN